MPIFHLLYSTQIYKSTFFGKIYCCHCVNSGTFQSLLYFGAGGIITETILVLQPLGAGLQGEGLHYPGVILAPLLEFLQGQLVVLQDHLLIGGFFHQSECIKFLDHRYVSSH